jgi:hypothetical protein
MTSFTVFLCSGTRMVLRLYMHLKHMVWCFHNYHLQLRELGAAVAQSV